MEPRYLELELTERVLMEGKESVEKTLDSLVQLGVRISLDHFGTGYASLDYLRRHPLSKAKSGDRHLISQAPHFERGACPPCRRTD